MPAWPSWKMKTPHQLAFHLRQFLALDAHASLGQLRWSSGLVLWIYVALHLANHGMGLVSLYAAETMRMEAQMLWRSIPGTVVLYGALVIHGAMALVAVWQRRSLRMPVMEAIRLALGLCLPLLLAAHFSATRWAFEIGSIDNDYERLIPSIWNPANISLQLLLLTAAWAHGCLGLHFALRARRAWQRWQPMLLTLAVLLPTLAALGVLAMAREIASGVVTIAQVTPFKVSQDLQGMTAGLRLGWLLLLATALAGPGLWRWLRPSAQTILLHYPGRTLQVPLGFSVLEASRAQGVEHLALCGGRARCSTCRVRVRGNNAHLPPPGPDERKTLERVHAPSDVRLACQLRPLGDIEVAPLFRPKVLLGEKSQETEREVVILFVDLRQWSSLSERQWPMDLSWVLDRYFELIGSAVQESGGVANQFIGDSVMAIFGLTTDLREAARQAIHASVLIDQRMQTWSQSVHAQFGQPIEFGIGIHAGSAALGHVGFESTTSFTAVGEVVNTASRLQEYSKVAQARLVLSADVARLAQLQGTMGTPQKVVVRGRSQPLEIFHVVRPAEHWGILKRSGPGFLNK